MSNTSWAAAPNTDSYSPTKPSGERPTSESGAKAGRPATTIFITLKREREDSTMVTPIIINISGGEVTTSMTPAALPTNGSKADAISDIHDMMGEQIGPFPHAGIDGFLSHFIMMLRFRGEPRPGRTVTVTSPPAVQVVARSEPFIYEGPHANHEIKVPLPPGCTLSNGPDPHWTTLRETDFLNRRPSSPDFESAQKFFVPGRETVWMQILDLDASMDTELGRIRILIGQTLLENYGDAGDPELLMPSLGAAQALRDSGGFPAALFFNPVAVIETEFGAFKAIHGTLSYGRVTSFPPIGTPVSISAMVPLPAVARPGIAAVLPAAPIGEIIALSHPIDVGLQISGSEAFNVVRDRIQAHAPARPNP